MIVSIMGSEQIHSRGRRIRKAGVLLLGMVCMCLYGYAQQISLVLISSVNGKNTYQVVSSDTGSSSATASGTAGTFSAKTVNKSQQISSCRISSSGPSTVSAGSSYTYSFSMNCGSTVSYWQITCGTLATGSSPSPDQGDESVLATWSANCGSTGVISALDNSYKVLASATVTIQAPPPPSAPAITNTGASLLCNNASTTLSAAGSGTITWYNSSGTSLYTGTTYTTSVAGTYYATASNSSGASGASNTITITTGVTPAAPALNYSGTQTICPNGSISLAATISNTGNTINWYYNNGESAISTNASINVTAATAGSYYATQGNTCGVSGNSSTVTVSVTPSPTVAAITGTTALCPGISVQLADATAGGVWSGGNASVATINSTGVVTAVPASQQSEQGSTTVTYTVTNSCNVSAAATATITINPAAPVSAPQINTAANPLCTGLSTTLTASSAGSSYYWYNSAGGSVISSGTTLPINTAGTYYASAYNGCGTGPQGSITITASSIPAAPSLNYSGNQPICPNGTIGLAATISNIGNTIQWYYNGQPNATTTSINVTAATAGSYSATQGNTCGVSGNSSTVTVSVIPSTTVSTITGTTALCPGTSVQLADATAGGVWGGGNASVATISSTGVVTAVPASQQSDQGSTTVTYTVTNSCNVSATASATITINPAAPVSAPQINTAANPLCTGLSTTLTASGAGASYYWYNSAGGSVIGSGTTLPINTAGTYYASAYNGCGTGPQASITITASSIPAAPALNYSGNQLICPNGTIGLAATISNIGNTINWYYNNGESAISTNASINVTAATAGSYSATQGNTCGVSGNSSTVTVSVIPSPTVAAITGTTALCPGTSVQLADATGGGVWSGGNANVATISSTGVVTAVPASQQSDQGSTTVYYIVTNSCNVSATASATITINPAAPVSAPQINTAANPLCAGLSTTLTASGGSLYYWYNSSGTTIIGGGTTLPISTAGTYYASAYNGCGTGPQGSITITASAIPAAPVVTPGGNQSICPNGGSVNLSTAMPAAGNSIVWNTQQQGYTINVSTPGTYSATQSNSCGVSASSNVVSVSYIDPTVAVPPIAAGSGTPMSTSVCVGSTLALADSVPGGVWSSSDTTIASLNGSTVTGLRTGAVNISYTVTSICGVATTVSIYVSVVNSLAVSQITGGGDTLCQYGRINFTDSTTGGIWVSSNPLVAAVDAYGGGVFGQGPGTANISYQLTNACGTFSAANPATVTVLAAPVLSPVTAIAGNLSSVCVGSTVSLTNTTAGGIWSSSNTGVAMVDNTGMVSGVSLGSAAISYVVTGACGVSQVLSTVTVSSYSGLQQGAVAPTKDWIGVGSALSLNNANAFPGGVWSSSNPLVASVDSSGNVSGIAPGLSVITYALANSCGLFSTNISVSNNTTVTPANSVSVATQPTAISAVTAPVLYGAAGITINYIRSRDAIIPDTNSVAFGNADYTQIKQNTQYFDGLGRLAETVMRQASPLANDMVSPVLYDSFGREPYKYMPYTSTVNDGNFKKDPFTAQASFMSAQYPGEQVYYGQTVFEPSPLNRVTQTLAPGNSWAGSARGITTEYRVNYAADTVWIWTITGNALTYVNNDISTNIPYTGAMYAPGQLSETHTIDEQGNRTVEYKDKDGRVVLKKVQIDAGATEGHTGWLSTYYVYDDFGLLRFVIPPKATAQLLSNNWQLSAGVINELCFRYEYDYRNRMIAKKVPGSGWVYMIYDQRDRLVFTQDANMRGNGQWLYTLYDVLNRPVQTGMMNGYTGSPAALQAYVTANTGNSIPNSLITNGNYTSSIPATVTYNVQNPAITDYRATQSISFTDGFTTVDNSNFIAEIVAGSDSSFSNTVTVLDNPLPPSITTTALTISNYDDYSQTTKTYNNTNNSKLDIGNNLYGDSLPTNSSIHTRGMVTSTRVRVIENPSNLNQGNWLETASFVDNKGRTVQVAADNYKGGLETATTRYDFTNKPICVYQTHTNPAANTSVHVKTNMDYDFGARLLAVRKTLNDDSTTTRTISQNSYNELGQLKNKHLGQQKNLDGTIGTSPLENQDFTYNIRGWLKGINWTGYGANGATAPVTSNTNNKWFAMDLSYDWGYQNNQYNGNISGQRWQTAGDGAERSFGYGYDNANRLLFADFKQNFGAGSSPNWANTAADNFNIDFTLKMGDGSNYATAYDENGNIKALWQKGLLLNTSATIDSLGYTYYNNSNKLQNVIDAQNNPNTLLGDFRSSSNYLSALGGTKTINAIDYTYDSSGNLQKDLNKDIGTAAVNGITYNHLNLPYQLTVYSPSVSGGIKGTITYIYDATGNKLEKRTLDDSANKTTYTTYIGGYVYSDNSLQFFAHEEGRVRVTQALVAGQQPAYNFDYFIKDQLGNTRVVLTDEQQQDVYPAATLEDGATATESTYYTINTADIVNNPVTLNTTYQNNNGVLNNNPTSNTGATSQKMYKLNGATGDKTGLGITLRVMSGDNVNIFGKSFWHNDGSTINNNNSIPVGDLISALSGSVIMAGLGVHTGATVSEITSSPVTPGDVTTLLDSIPVPVLKPKAYINWILFDDQFRPVKTSSGFDAVSDNTDQLKVHAENVSIGKNGYLYVYCSNESNQDVFFDNLQVIHTRGPLLEETHYYPFGLTMAGISSKAAGKLENKYKYNGIELQHQEFSDGSGLETYSTFYRMLDPQLGRWWQIDPKCEIAINPEIKELTEDQDYIESLEGISPYASMNNNPVKYKDPKGDEAGGAVVAGDPTARAAKIFGTTQKIAGAIEVIGGGPENPVADVAALGTEIVGGLISLGVLVHDELSMNKATPVQSSKTDAKDDKKQAPGTTASGHPTDEHGNKLGPSGKPQINTVKHPNEKSAKDAARYEGKGAPVKHTNPKKGEDHYHPTDKDGNKKPGSTHHEY